MTTQVFVEQTFPTRASRFVGYGQYLLDTRNGPGSGVVKVIGGHHAGMTCAFTAAGLTIGSDNSNDLILFADDLADKHIRLEPAPGLHGNIRIHAVEGELVLDDGSTIAIGQWRDVPAQTVLSIGKTELELGSVLDKRQTLRLAVLCVSVAVLALLFVIATNSLWKFSSRSIQALQGVNFASTHKTVIGTHDAVSAGVDVSTREAADRSRQKLKALGIGHLVSVRVSDNSALHFQGSISELNGPQWTSFLQWYDGRITFPQLVNSVATQGKGGSIPPIAAVWIDGNPMVEFEDGFTGEIGSVSPAGWTIVDILPANVVIERNGARVSLKY